jgi:hypothetical protein
VEDTIPEAVPAGSGNSPSPRVNLVRYQGILAPAAHHRTEVVPVVEKSEDLESAKDKTAKWLIVDDLEAYLAIDRRRQDRVGQFRLAIVRAVQQFTGGVGLL